MGWRISDETVDRIRQEVSLVELVSRYTGSQLRRSGGRLFTLCPFHHEKTPSFSISEEKNLYHCFGCEAGGDILTFVMEYKRLSYPEAIKELCETFNIPLEASRSEMQRMQKRADLHELNEVAATYFHKNLLGSTEGAKAAREYVLSRLSEDTIKQWKLGYASDDWEELSNRLKIRYSPELLKASGLVKERESSFGNYDIFRNRIIFPIRDRNSKVIGFAGRTLSSEERVKYLNSPETALYKKSEVFYGIDKAFRDIRNSREVVIVEGYFDVLAAHEKGITNSICLGGYHLTDFHIKMLSSMAERIFLWYDDDEAGRRATLNSGKAALSKGIVTNIIALPGGDPDEILREQGGCQRFLEEKAKQKSLVDFALETTGLKGISNPDEQYRIVREQLFELVSATKSPLHKWLWLKKINEELGFKTPVVAQDYQRYLREQAGTHKSDSSEKPRQRPIEDFLLGFLAANPAYRRVARTRFTRDDFSSVTKGWFFDFLCSHEASEGLSIKPKTHLGYGPLFHESGIINVVKEFKEYYTDINPVTNEKESMIVSHEVQLSGLESLLKDTAHAKKSVIDRMEMAVLSKGLEALESEIIVSRNNNRMGFVDPDIINDFQRIMARYQELESTIELSDEHNA